MAQANLNDVVSDLRKRLEQYVLESSDPKKFVKVLKNLDVLDISVDCLRETGIGKVVNSLRKQDGDIGIRAKDLITKWKAISSSTLVSSEHSNQKPSSSSRSTPVSTVSSSSKSNSCSEVRSSSKRPFPESSSPISSSHLQKVIAMLPNLEEDPSMLELLSPHDSSMASTSSRTSTSTLDTADAPYKKSRMTKVFSGKARARSFAQVPKLVELCIRVLLDHINEIEEMGPVPYHVIKPVLEACTPTQLTKLEMFNTHLLDDTDELWARHCGKEFHVEELEDDREFFRDLYARKLQERDEKLEHLKKSIAARSRERAAPVRHTQVASFPARQMNRGRIQAVGIIKNGCVDNGASSSNSGGIRAAIKSMGVPPAPARGRNSGGAGSAASFSVAPKKGPLMQKSMKAFKKQFRR